MSRTIMGEAMSLDGFIADDHDGVGPLFDFSGNGDVTWTFPGSDNVFHSTQATADFMRTHYGDIAVIVVGRRVFELTNGRDGQPPAGEHVIVVTHEPPIEWEHAASAPGRPFFATGALGDVAGRVRDG